MKKGIAIVLSVLLMLTCFPTVLVSASDTTVSNTAQLKTAVDNAVAGDTISLSSDFTFGVVALTMPNASVTIDGNGLTWTGSGITVSGAGTGQLTIKNLKMDAASAAVSTVHSTATNGHLILENMELYNSTKGALNLSTGANAQTTIIGTRIYNNTASNIAPAIWLGNTANVTINSSTIEDNIGTGGGYETGAIGSKQQRGNITINNTVFRNNVNKGENTGSVGGGGGAMSLHYFYGNLKINESNFVGNQTNGADGTVKSTFDGGAIYILDGGGTVGATISIDKTTFDSNLAYDDGGAIMIQGTGKPGLTTTITNSTFYNNKAYGLSGGNRSGGAIQFFKNGSQTTLTNTVTSCTFVGNQAGNESTRVIQQGGAIGLSGAGILAIAAVTTNNSIFIGSQVYGADGTVNLSSKFKDVSNSATVQAGTTNVMNVDGGSATTPYTTEDVLGQNNTMLTTNYSTITAGVDGEIVKTIPIKPEGIADNTYTGSAAASADQRTYSKDKDQGAIEAAWVKYNANGGEFGLAALTSYDGKIYYENSSANYMVEDYYTVGYVSGTTKVADTESFIATHPEGKILAGWSANKDAIEPDSNYTVGTDLSYSKDNLTLYAVWNNQAPTTHTVTFHPEGGTFSDNTTAPKAVQIEIEATVAEEIVTNVGAIFDGWYTDDSFNTKYNFTTPITTNLDLYAKWIMEEYTVKFEANNESTSPPDQIVNHGALANEPAVSYAGHTFAGWYTTSDCEFGTEWDFNTPITSTLTLSAKWEAIMYTVTFDTKGGTPAMIPQSVAEGGFVRNPGKTTKPRDTFMGWYPEGGSKVWNFKVDQVDSDLVLVAKWNNT